ncbi:hypothetical protein ACEQ8H_003256 [Pleosporales sp. CAS-2024a]
MVPAPGQRSLLATTTTTAAICALALASTLLAPCHASDAVPHNTTRTPGYSLLPGIASVPAPVRVAPDQGYAGIDGQWSTFSLMVGRPATNVRVQVSTASQQIWVINRQACLQNVTDAAGKIVQYNQLNENCETTRGLLYDQATSTAWHQKGYYRLWLEKWIGLEGNGLFGWDYVGIGQAGEKGPSLQSTIIGTLVSPDFWMGHIGLHPKPTNFSAFEDPVPSFMTGLFEQQSIPSLSFGYTAGAPYRTAEGNSFLGSLTLGGYDTSRMIPNDLTFVFAPDNERDLVVGVPGLTAKTATKKNINLLQRNDLNMYIDSTIAEIWLPLDVCRAFEDAFGLQYDNKTNLYLVDDALHQSLLAQNLSITFTLGQKIRTDTTMQITLPYAALDLEASPPYRGLQQKTKYFPIRQGRNSSQWVLGRTFLQEAYLTVDWERQNFSVSAVNWTWGQEPAIIPIVSPRYAMQDAVATREKPLVTAAIIGIALGGGFVFTLITIAVGWWFWRKRHQRKMAAIKAKYEAHVAAAALAKKEPPVEPEETPTSPMQESETGTRIFPKAELPAEPATSHEVDSSPQEKDTQLINEADNTERQIFEMLGCIPEPTEAGGRQLSEKESMVVRERIYNGVDPQSPSTGDNGQIKSAQR